jgi:hypothetical protein
MTDCFGLRQSIKTRAIKSRKIVKNVTTSKPTSSTEIQSGGCCIIHLLLMFNILLLAKLASIAEAGDDEALRLDADM